MHLLPPSGRHQRGPVGAPHNGPRGAALAVVLVLSLMALLLTAWTGGGTRAAAVAVAVAADDSPGSCNEVIDGVPWNLDPCIPVNGPYPPDFAAMLASIQDCPGSGPSPTTTTAQAMAAAAIRPHAAVPITSAASVPADAPPTSPSSPSSPTSPSPTSASPSSTPPTNPSSPPTTEPPTTEPPTTDPVSPTPSGSGSATGPSPTSPSPTDSPLPCTTYTAPTPDPSYSASPTDSSPVTGSASASTGPSSTAPTSTTPTDSVSPTQSTSPTESTSPTDSASPTESTSPTDSASPTDSDSPTDSATPTDSDSPTDSATPTDSDSPTDSTSATATGTDSGTGSPSPTSSDQCGLPTPTDSSSTLAAPPGESADLIQCRNPATIPDPANPVTLVATGDSITSAHNQTGFGIGTCDNTAADARGLTGNDANFSYAGKYFTLNKQIIAYYNFARTGFTTSDIRNAAAGKTSDACGNDWNRNDTPLNLAVKVIKAAKAAKSAAYFVTTGGVNNTDWTQVVAKLAECQGLGFATDTLLAGVPLITTSFRYIVPQVLPTDGPFGQYKNIITKGGACYATVKLGGPFPQTWWTRVAVPAYDGPGSPAPSALSNQIGPDATAIVNAVLGAGADKVVWMLYYDISPADIDVANLGLAAAKAKMPAWVTRNLPATVTAFPVSLIDPALIGQVKTLVANLNKAISGAIAANPKVAVQAAPALTVGDIQNTGIGGSPHPNDSGHTKLSTTLNAAFNGL
jgi:hypothetical protein